MENNPASHSTLLIKAWAAGGIANAVTSALLNPLDVAKTRLQSAKRGADVGMISTLRVLYAQGGVVGLYRPGLSASCFREMLSSGPRAGLYVPFRDAAIAYSGRSPDSVSIKIAVAMACGIVGSVIANPIDVIKVRLMAADSHSPAMTTAQALASCWRNEGWRGLYRGLVPSTLRGMFIAAGELATYDIAKSHLKQELLVKDGAGLHVAASLITGIVAACVASPFDVAKTLAMSAGPGQPGASVALASLVRLKGPLVLFRGLVPSYLRLGPHALISFPLFEQVRFFLGLDYV